MTTLFPSIIPDTDDDPLTPQEVTTDIFEDDFPLMRKAIAVAGDQYDHELEVNGRSTKVEIANWMAENMTRGGLQTLKETAREEMNESD
jgi:hypothetical protein